MTDRLTKIFELLPNFEVFADVGCDHGYMAKAMLDSGKASKVIISDISAKCLKKAEQLLKGEIDSGRVKSLVSNGFEKLDECDLALVAGMGGEEICAILNNAPFLPEKLVLQPMKNCDKVRVFGVNLGYKIEKDFVFKAGGKFYEIMLLVKGTDKLSPEEIEFGRTNLLEKPLDFIEFIEFKLEKIKKFSAKKELKDQTRQELDKQIERLSKYVKI